MYDSVKNSGFINIKSFFRVWSPFIAFVENIFHYNVPLLAFFNRYLKEKYEAPKVVLELAHKHALGVQLPTTRLLWWDGAVWSSSAAKNTPYIYSVFDIS